VVGLALIILWQVGFSARCVALLAGGYCTRVSGYAFSLLVGLARSVYLDGHLGYRSI
jgi:hypothetical protein